MDRVLTGKTGCLRGPEWFHHWPAYQLELNILSRKGLSYPWCVVPEWWPHCFDTHTLWSGHVPSPTTTTQQHSLPTSSINPWLPPWNLHRSSCCDICVVVPCVERCRARGPCKRASVHLLPTCECPGAMSGGMLLWWWLLGWMHHCRLAVRWIVRRPWWICGW